VVKISIRYFIEEPLMICYNINHLFVTLLTTQFRRANYKIIFPSKEKTIRLFYL